MTQVPMPNSCHPSLEDVAEAIRSSGDRLQHVQIPKVALPVATMGGADEDPIAPAFPILTLVQKRCAGPAPYVGRPFAYQWWVWVADDGTNRAIAGDAQIVYRDQPW